MDKLIKDLRGLAALYDGSVPAIYDVIAKAADELEKRRWVPVEERLPGPYESVLLSIRTKNGYGDAVTYETIGTCMHGNWNIDIGTIHKDERVTHWMPMPEPPKGDEA